MAAAPERPGQVLGALGPEMDRSQCRLCGANKALLCNFNGLGIRRRRHERRCAARRHSVASTAARPGETAAPHGGSDSAHVQGQSSSSSSRGEARKDNADALPSRSGWRGRVRQALQMFSTGAQRLSPSLSREPSSALSLPSSASTVSVVAPAAAAAALTTAIWLEAPIMAGSFFVATAALWWRSRRDARTLIAGSGEQAEAESTTASVARSHKADLEGLLAPTDEALPSTVCSEPAANSAEFAEVSRLVQSFRIREALTLAEANGLLDAAPPRAEPVEVAWLRDLAPRARDALVGLCVPPAPATDGGAWTGPLESSGDEWQMSLWYRWSGPTMLSTVSRLSVPGSLAQALSIFREADLLDNWVPFVNKCSSSWSDKLPALVSSFQAKIPIVPRTFNTVVHRAFLDTLESEQSSGVLLVEWTPSPSDFPSGSYCGMELPRAPVGASEMTVKLSTTLVQPESQARCSIVMSGNNDFKVSRRLLPDVVVRKFLAMNSKVLASRICSCLQDLSGKGYLERLRLDPQGFYGLVEKRCAENAARH